MVSRIGLIALALATVLFPLSMLAQPPGHGGHRGMAGHHPTARGLHHLFAQLDLTDEQKDQVRAIFSEAKEESQESREAYRSAERALKGAIHADTFDEGAIRQAAAAVAAFEGDRAVAKAEVFQEILKILTPEQREKLAEIRAERRERIEERGERGPRGARGGHRG